VRDITERKQAEEHLQQAHEEITLLNKKLKEENLRMKAELEITRRLQEMILPKKQELQQIKGLEIASFMKPAEEVGGDYYDILEHQGHIRISIGDVTGHGLESGILMLMVQTAMRTLLVNCETNLVKILNTINRTIYDNVQRMGIDKNLSLCLLDYHADELLFAGQHESLIVVRQGKIELVNTLNFGFPIGLESNISEFIVEHKIHLTDGDVIVLYTDGVTEAANEYRKLYGLERLCKVITRHWHYSAEEIKQAIINDVLLFIGHQEIFDDITLLVLKQNQQLPSKDDGKGVNASETKVI
jgi:serine phosphatase RsbU (regulator of sigma subunit)